MEKDTEEDGAVCIFIEFLSNCHKRQFTDFIKLSETCLQIVIKASKMRKDNLDILDDEEIIAHKACLLKYTSSDQISRHLKCDSNGKKQKHVPTKCTRRSNASFDFKKTVFSVQILVVLNLVPNILTGAKRIKLCCTADQEKGKKVG